MRTYTFLLPKKQAHSFAVMTSGPYQGLFSHAEGRQKSSTQRPSAITDSFKWLGQVCPGEGMWQCWDKSSSVCALSPRQLYDGLLSLPAAVKVTMQHTSSSCDISEVRLLYLLPGDLLPSCGQAEGTKILLG